MKFRGLIIFEEVYGNSVKIPKFFMIVSLCLLIWLFCCVFQAYPSHKPLGSWTRDLVARVEQFAKWAETGHQPIIFWVAGFTFPSGFLTAVLQTCARRNNVRRLAWFPCSNEHFLMHVGRHESSRFAIVCLEEKAHDDASVWMCFVLGSEIFLWLARLVKSFHPCCWYPILTFPH